MNETASVAASEVHQPFGIAVPVLNVDYVSRIRREIVGGLIKPSAAIFSKTRIISGCGGRIYLDTALY